MSAFFIIFAVERRACLHQPLKDGNRDFCLWDGKKKRNMTVTYKKKDQTNKH